MNQYTLQSVFFSGTKVLAGKKLMWQEIFYAPQKSLNLIETKARA